MDALGANYEDFDFDFIGIDTHLDVESFYIPPLPDLRSPSPAAFEAVMQDHGPQTRDWSTSLEVSSHSSGWLNLAEVHNNTVYPSRVQRMSTNGNRPDSATLPTSGEFTYLLGGDSIKSYLPPLRLVEDPPPPIPPKSIYRSLSSLANATPPVPLHGYNQPMHEFFDVPPPVPPKHMNRILPSYNCAPFPQPMREYGPPLPNPTPAVSSRNKPLPPLPLFTHPPPVPPKDNRIALSLRTLDRHLIHMHAPSHTESYPRPPLRHTPHYDYVEQLALSPLAPCPPPPRRGARAERTPRSGAARKGGQDKQRERDREQRWNPFGVLRLVKEAFRG